MTNFLTDTEREALRTAVRVDLHDTGEPLFAVVERIVRARMADAWNEGWHAGWDDGSLGDYTANPYRDEEATA